MTKTNSFIKDIYDKLLLMYKPQGWWPVIVDNKMKYYPGDYSVPKNKKQQYEIVLGTILTQNTSWNNAASALINLHDLDVYTPEDLLNLSLDTLIDAVTVAGFKNQKSQYLINISNFLIDSNYKFTRSELLSVKGVGNETADSILLYAFNKEEFVVDTYTKRILTKLGLCKDSSSYNDIKKIFTQNLDSDVNMFKEYHALLVEHAKHYYQKKPYGVSDPLLKLIK